MVWLWSLSAAAAAKEKNQIQQSTGYGMSKDILSPNCTKIFPVLAPTSGDRKCI